MRWNRNVRRALLAMSLCASGCSRSTPPPVQDSASDWEDVGPYAACTVDTLSSACGEESNFDLSACDKASLAGLPADAVYTLVYRGESTPPIVSADSWRVSQDGSLDSFKGTAPTARHSGSDRFYLSSTRTTSKGVTVRNAVAGCRAEGSRLYGCYVNCRDGQATGYGTFLAQRWEPRAGESESSGMRLVSESFVPRGLPVDVYVAQGHAYVVSLPNAGQAGGLTVFDVSNRAAPVLQKTISLPNDNYWNDVWSQGNALYVASASSGLLVFDLTDPASPQLLRGLPSGRGAIEVHTLFIEGDRLYAMAPWPTPQTFIFDIRKPTEPVMLGQYSLADTGLSPTGYPHDALALDGRLYINHWSDGYVIVDVKDPQDPHTLGSFSYPYATSHANAVGRIGERLIAFEGGESWGAHLRILDVTDPAKPTRVGEYKLGPNASTHNMILQGTRLYLAHYQHGVRVLDVSVPESPRQVAYYNTFRPGDAGRGSSFYEGAIGMRVPGDGYVYVIDTSRGLLIFPEP